MNFSYFRRDNIFFRYSLLLEVGSDDAVHHWTSDKPSVVKYEGRSILLRDLKKGKRKKRPFLTSLFLLHLKYCTSDSPYSSWLFVHYGWKLDYVLERKLYFPLLLKEAFPFYLYFLLNLRNLIWHIFSMNLTSISNCLTI